MEWPLLQVLLADRGPGSRASRTRVSLVVVESIRLQVDVADCRTAAADDESFWMHASRSALRFRAFTWLRLLIARGSVRDRLERLLVGIDWLGAPAVSDSTTGYLLASGGKAEDSPFVDNLDLKATLKFVDRRAAFTVKEVPLFETRKSETTKAIAESCWFEVERGDIEKAYAGYGRTLDLHAAAEPIEWTRRWQLELGPKDFQRRLSGRGGHRRLAPGHDEEPVVPNPLILNPPYTPKIKRLRLYYSASIEIRPAQDPSDAPDRFYHVEPFGHRLAPRPELATDVPLLPQFDADGELLVGLEGVVAPQNIALLFQMAPGSADPDLPHGELGWSFLDGDDWRPLGGGRVLSDTTRSPELRIITFDVPAVRAHCSARPLLAGGDRARRGWPAGGDRCPGRARDGRAGPPPVRRFDSRRTRSGTG
jgi:hypothetical protein